MKSYLNCRGKATDEKFFEFPLKKILLKILQNVVIYLFGHFVLHVTVIGQTDTFPYHMTNQR